MSKSGSLFPLIPTPLGGLEVEVAGKALQQVVGVVKFVYDVYQQVKANKAKCKRIVKQLKSVEIIVTDKTFMNAIESLGEAPECLVETHVCLVNASQFMAKYGKKHIAKKVFTVYKVAEAFDEVQEEFDIVVRHLNLFVSSQAFAIVQLNASYGSSTNLASLASQASNPTLQKTSSNPLQKKLSEPSSEVQSKISSRQQSVVLKKGSVMPNIESQRLKLADAKDELREGNCDQLIVFWVDPRPENNGRMISRANKESQNVIFITLSSTGELLDALISLRPVLYAEDDLRIRVVTNTWQPNFGAFKEDYDKEIERNTKAWQEVVEVTENFLQVKIPTLVFSIEEVDSKLTKKYLTSEPAFVNPGKGFPWFNNLVENAELHRFLTFSTVFFIWREVTDEVRAFYEFFTQKGVPMMMLDCDVIAEFFSKRPYLSSTPIAVICNRYVTGPIQELVKYAPEAGVFVFTGQHAESQAKSDFSGILSERKGGVYTDGSQLQTQCLKMLQNPLTYKNE